MGCGMQPLCNHKGRTMRRFSMNRWWVLLLAAVLAIGTLPGLVAPASARISLRNAQIGGADSSYGDPDVPNGQPLPGRMNRTGGVDRGGVGDGPTTTELGSIHLRVMLELMRAYLFH